MSVAEAQERIDAREFAEWMAYFGLRPFGETAEDYRAALVAATVANTAPRKGAALRLEKFLLFQEPDESETQAVIQQYFKKVEPDGEAECSES